MKPTRLIIVSLALTLSGFASLHAQVQKPEIVVEGGQVKTPGVVQYRKNSTILAMINDSGGSTNSASMKRVIVVRNGKKLMFDLTNDKMKNAALAMPDDSIEVPTKTLLERVADAL